MYSFTSWDTGLRQDELEHHGIKGMHWGQRRFQNEDGSLTPAGRERYGTKAGEGTKKTSARKMQKDFNRLDQGYANVEAYRMKNLSKTKKYARKAYKGSNSEKKLEKLRGKAIKYGKKAALNQKQKEAIEKLQWQIIGKAAKNGYTTTGQGMTRYGKTKAQRIVDKILSQNSGIPVSGQSINIRKHGSGKTLIVNYNAAKSEAVQKILQEEKDKERARQFAGIRR